MQKYFIVLEELSPDYIRIADAYNGIDKKYDIIFVGWMEPGVDYRDKISQNLQNYYYNFRSRRAMWNKRRL